MTRITLAVLALTLGGCSGNPNTRDQCIAEYGSQAETKNLVRAAYGFCTSAFNESLHQVVRDRSLCIVKQVPALKTDMALAAVRLGCDANYPTPGCGAGEAFSLENGRCERPIVDPFDP